MDLGIKDKRQKSALVSVIRSRGRLPCLILTGVQKVEPGALGGPEGLQGL